jgi:D-threo-aldose 1-dehydrogenase
VLEQRFRQVMDSGFRALDELRRAGVIGAIGVGLNEADMSLRFLKAGNFDCVLLAGRYTLLEQGALAAFMPECVKRNASVILGGPFNSGILAGGDTYNYNAAPPEMAERARRLRAVCDRHNVPLAAAALQFPLAHEAVCSVIPGALNISEVTQNVAHMGRRIPVDLWAELVREGLLDPAAPVPTQ